jgi:hypothetical protein
MAGKRGRPSVVSRYLHLDQRYNNPNRILSQVGEPLCGRSLANRCYEQQARMFLILAPANDPEKREQERQRFAWVLRRRVLMYELGRTIAWLRAEFPEGDVVHIVRFVHIHAALWSQDKEPAARTAARHRHARRTGELRRMFEWFVAEGKKQR